MSANADDERAITEMLMEKRKSLVFINIVSCVEKNRNGDFRLYR